jgi:hypothetical protein
MPVVSVRERTTVANAWWMRGELRCELIGEKVGDWYLVKMLCNGVVGIEGNLHAGRAVLVCRDGRVASGKTFPADCAKVVDIMERLNATQGQGALDLTVSGRCVNCLPVLWRMGYTRAVQTTEMRVYTRAHGLGIAGKAE